MEEVRAKKSLDEGIEKEEKIREKKEMRGKREKEKKKNEVSF